MKRLLDLFAQMFLGTQYKRRNMVRKLQYTVKRDRENRQYGRRLFA